MGSRATPEIRPPLYSPQERQRRDASVWTRVQGVLAPLQFLAFLISLALVVRFLVTGNGAATATVSIVIKTACLYAIMVTGCLWERDVFGRYLFARAFFWEDVVSMAVLALHSAYLVLLATRSLELRLQMFVALAAYAAYLTNATQFLLKLRHARHQARREAAECAAPTSARPPAVRDPKLAVVLAATE